MAPWEFGEHLAFLFRWTGIAWLATRIFKCRCDARRAWCNEQGERLYARLCPMWHCLLLGRFAAAVLRATEHGACTAESIQSGLPVSLHTRRRWLDEMVREGVLGSITLSGVKHYAQLSRCISGRRLLE